MEAFSSLCLVARLPPLSNKIVTYISFVLELIKFNVLSLRVNGFAPVTQSKLLEYFTGPFSSLDGGDSGAPRRVSGHHSAFWYIKYVLFDMRHDTIGKIPLYELGES